VAAIAATNQAGTRLGANDFTRRFAAVGDVTAAKESDQVLIILRQGSRMTKRAGNALAHDSNDCTDELAT
jgi:hypothetical protein